MTDHPVAREMIGYLLVRGGVHILAYAKALEGGHRDDEGVPQGAPIPEHAELPEEFAPGVSQEDVLEIAKRLQNAAGIK